MTIGRSTSGENWEQGATTQTSIVSQPDRLNGIGLGRATEKMSPGIRP